MIGIIPAAGKAERMHGLPKMLLPLPDGQLIARLARQIESAAIEHCLVGTNTTLFNAGCFDGLVNESVTIWDVGFTDTMSETVLGMQHAVTPVQDVLFGMPDTYIEDEQAFVKLAACLDSGADVAVGVFKAREGQHAEGGMVRIHTEPTWIPNSSRSFITDYVAEVIDKPAEPVSGWIWGVLAWRPAFWQHINPADPHVGFGVQRAIEAGMDVRAVKMDGGFWDCGTPERYFRLINHLTGKSV